MRLVDLDPRWVRYGGEGITHNGQPVPLRESVGVSFACPCKGTCPRVYIPFANPLDGGPQVGEQGWQRTGDAFESLTLTPSIARREGCKWHGLITGGAVLTC